MKWILGITTIEKNNSRKTSNAEPFIVYGMEEQPRFERLRQNRSAEASRMSSVCGKERGNAQQKQPACVC